MRDCASHPLWIARSPGALAATLKRYSARLVAVPGR